MNIINPSVVALITNLKEKNVNIHTIAKSAGLSWQKTKNALFLMHYYGLVEIKNTRPKVVLLTQDGITVKNIVIKLDYIIHKNESKFKEQFIEDVEGDIL